MEREKETIIKLSVERQATFSRSLFFGTMPLAHIGGRLTVLIMALGAVDIINSIGLSVAQVSILILLSSLTALTAPWLGIIIDRWEPRKFYIISIVISLLSLIGLALSSSFMHFLLVAVMAGPIFEGLSASATKLIARHVFPGKKGDVARIKSS